MSRQPIIALPISRAFGVLTAIDFDDEALLSAHEIDDIWTDALLPSEFVTIELSPPQMMPDAAFRVGHFAA